MEKTALINLDLRSPLYYSVVDKLPIKFNENDEFLLFFELNPIQSQSIEPDRDQLRGNLVFSGVKTETSQQKDNLAQQMVVLPAGKYLFTQRRDALSDENSINFYTDWFDLAVEQQKDALWERNKMTNKLYVRYLFEDGKFVTQIFREEG